MILFLIIMLVLIIGGGYLIFRIIKHKKSTKSNFSVKDIVKPTNDSSNVGVNSNSSDEDIEVLDIYSDDEKISASNNNYDLDDLFKTISMTAIDNSDFDFGLRRSDKK